MIIINSKNITFKSITDSLYIYLREKHINCILSENLDLNSDNLYIFIGINGLIKKYPPKYIIYQFEQTDSFYYNEQHEKEYNYIFNDSYLNILRNAHQIWDYSLQNKSWLEKNMNLKNIIHVPICFSHTLYKKKIQSQVKDIDILFFGSLNPKRKKILEKLQEYSHINLVIRNNDCWEDDLDNLIGRSRIILNIHYYENAILEMHRLSYLLINKCFIISETVSDSSLVDVFNQGLIFSKYNKIVETCIDWLNNKTEQERSVISNLGHQTFKKYDYQNYIPSFLSNYSGNHKSKKSKINWYIPTILKESETSVSSEGHYVLKLPQIDDNELPCISIITPTGNRRKLFSIAINNFHEIIYPRHKIEWVIVDDGQEDLSDLLRFSKQIKYFKINPPRLSIGEKRNLCIQKCTHDYIVCMDDDDYYPPSSVLGRIKTLLKYPHINCVGCNNIGVFDIIKHRSYLASDGPKYFSEASMAFRKSFWNQRPFYQEDKQGEGKYFCLYREHEMMSIPFQFVIIALKHRQNTTNSIRNISENNSSQKQSDLFKLFEPEMQFFLETLKKTYVD